MRLEFRGSYQYVYKQFLLEMGGREVDDAHLSEDVVIAGEGWTAHLSPEDWVEITKVIRIPRTFITFSGDPEKVDRLIAQFRLKALRGGG
ncbi:hypothetical protein [Effusibacillus dendaii]|uniref:Molybdopterin cofactor biosynthesis MoaD-related C-terminal domain-containing protein n=1 Tax=Effusibacillus dendaii TaxID=2743772 RepID=A0A7I8DAL0_9BACL|nr:hypothetical protein [Effusibacillus dendaii]BCJ87223.1 hypothetical protein skT53_22080 [Effusibacillus dendaii]